MKRRDFLALLASFPAGGALAAGQSPDPVPSSFGSAVPFTSTWNVPAACALHGAVQLRV